jgi:hypothetical protein
MFKTEIANLALRNLGVSSYLSDLETDNSTEARIIRRFFKISLESLLEHNDWTFARKTAVLNLNEQDPEHPFKYSYDKPVDAVVVREIACEGYFIDPSVNHYSDELAYFEERQEGTLDLIYCSVQNAHAKYTQMLNENINFKNYFGRALAGQLSLEIGPAIITNNWPKVQNAINTMANNQIGEGIAEDVARSPQKNYSPAPMVRKRFQ